MYKFVLVVLFFLATILSFESSAQLGKFVKGKVKEKTSKMGKEEKEEKEKQQQETKESSSTKESSKTASSSKSAPLDFSQGDPYWSLSTLFDGGLKLNKESGEISFENLNVFNMPEKDQSGNDVNYYSEQDVQLILNKIDLGGNKVKEIGSTKVTPSLSRGLAYLDPEKSSMQITEPGYYKLNLKINGNVKEDLKFLVKKGTKDGVTRYYLDKPWGQLGNLKVKEPGNEEFFQLQFELLHSAQTLEESSSAGGKDVIAKLYNDDTEEVLAIAPNNSGGIYSKQEWDGHNLKFYEDADGHDTYKAADLMKKEGNFSIRVKMGEDENYDEKYVYQFAIKDGEIKGRNDSETYNDKKIFNNLQSVWIQGQSVGGIKLDGVQTPSKTSGMKETIGFLYETKNQTRGCRYPEQCNVKDGDVFSLLDLTLPKDMHADTKLKDVIVILTLMKGDEILAQNAWEESCGDEGCTSSFYMPLVPKLDVYGYNNQVADYAKAFAKLPAGKHNLKLVAEVRYGKDTKKVFGYSEFTYTSTAGNPKYTEMIPKLEERLSMTEDELSLEHWEKYGGPDPVTLVNNCGRTVWLRNTSSEAELYLTPGREYSYDRNEGYLEQWNFGTKRWKIISHVFKVNRDEKVNICK